MGRLSSSSPACESVLSLLCCRLSNEVRFSVARFVGRINVYNDLNDPVVR